MSAEQVAVYMTTLGQQARKASRVIARAPTAVKNAALLATAEAIEAATEQLVTANQLDLQAGRDNGLDDAMLDRLALTPARLAAMVEGLRQVASLDDPVGALRDMKFLPSGIQVGKMRVPLGVIGIIYESRPNVTVEAASLCLKSGNACILRGGSESIHSNRAIAECLRQGLAAAGLPNDVVQVVETTDRAAVGALITMPDYVDVIVPRGGKSLIERVTAESRVPLFKHLEGNCHSYVHADADPDMARNLVVNAKMRRTGICGATETMLIDRAAVDGMLAAIVNDLIDAGCEVRGDEAAQVVDSRINPATEADWDTEYLDSIIAVKVVDGIDDAIGHITLHGSDHTDCIITGNAEAAETFINKVDSAIVLVNASTQFADGGEFGMGAEIGISTGKLHARGPVGVEQLTTSKYVVRGEGQTRP